MKAFASSYHEITAVLLWMFQVLGTFQEIDIQLNGAEAREIGDIRRNYRYYSLQRSRRNCSSLSRNKVRNWSITGIRGICAQYKIAKMITKFFAYRKPVNHHASLYLEAKRDLFAYWLSSQKPTHLGYEVIGIHGYGEKEFGFVAKNRETLA